MLSEQFPRVVSLTYSIAARAGYDYGEKCELNGALPGFAYRLRQRVAEFLPTEYIATEEEARARLEPLLRAWEVNVALNHARGVLEFVFARCDVQKEAPRPGFLELRGAAMTFSGAVATLTTTFRASHPPPPDAFATNEFVATVADLYLMAQDYPRVLLYIAYGVTTCVREYFDGYANAAKSLSVSTNVFEEIRRLSHTLGTGAERRKGGLGPSSQPITDSLRGWLMTMLREIALRAGASAAGASAGAEITLATHPVPKQ